MAEGSEGESHESSFQFSLSIQGNLSNQYELDLRMIGPSRSLSSP